MQYNSPLPRQTDRSESHEPWDPQANESNFEKINLRGSHMQAGTPRLLLKKLQ